MSQRVVYAPLQGTRYDQYPFKLRQIFDLLQGPSRTGFRGFRDYLRKQGLWDKDSAEATFSLVGLRWNRTQVSVAGIGKKLAASQNDGEFQDILFAHLKRENILLVKYVLEALHVEEGGRLHSVHELYRMITSYVYPGAHITLTSFQAWVEWLAATGYIRLIGIRWALSEKGKVEASELRSIDVEEILEDMEEDSLDDAEDEEDDDDAFFGDDDGLGGAADDEDGGEADGFEDNDGLDLPPEPELPVFDAPIGGVGEELAEEGTAGAHTARERRPSGRASKPRVAHGEAPLLSVGAVGGKAEGRPWQGGQAPLALALGSPQVVVLGDTSKKEVEAYAKELWSVFSDWPRFTAKALGLLPKEGQGDLVLLMRLGLTASLIEGQLPNPALFAFVKAIDNSEFFASLAGGAGFDAALESVAELEEKPWARPYWPSLIFARSISQKVSMKIDLLPQLKAAESAEAALELLREHMFGKRFLEAPFWVLRELVRLEILDGKKLSDALAVPNLPLRKAAYRIGLLSHDEPMDWKGLLALSQAVSKWLGKEEYGYGEALGLLASY